MGLIYLLLSKGTLGDSQMAWFKEHLLDPYARAVENLSRDRVQLMQDFKQRFVDCLRYMHFEQRYHSFSSFPIILAKPFTVSPSYIKKAG